MTDPVTNVEIEDVLSSIRRLVSENGRGVAKRDVPEAADEADEPAVPAAQDASDAPDEPAALAAQYAPDELIFLDTPPESAGVDRPEAAAEAPAPQDDTLVLTPALRVGELAAEEARGEAGGFAEVLQSAVQEALDEAVDEAMAPFEGEDEGEDVQADEASHAAEAGETLKERIAGLEAAVAEQEDEWEPDGDGEDAYAGSPVETLAWEDHLEEEARDDGFVHGAGDLSGDPSEELAEEPAEEPAAVEEAAFVEVEADDEIGAAPEPVFVHGAAPEPKPVPQAADELAEGFDDAEAEDLGAPEEAVDLFGGETSVIDEEMLREMVADIVRQELQGTLGERITRNVRKLVRREIHRALAAHELD